MMEHVPTSILCDERCHLGEGPTYDAATDTALLLGETAALDCPADARATTGDCTDSGHGSAQVGGGG